LPWRYDAEMGTRCTLRHNTASIMRGWFIF